MTDKEKLEAIRAEILHRLVHVNGYSKEMANELFAFINSLPDEPISEDLEEAADKYSDMVYEKNKDKKNPDWNSYSYGYEDAISRHIADAVIYGANWKEKQMMKDAIDAEVEQEYYNPNLPLYIDTIYVDDRADLKRGDKVKVIIIKED